jgi:quinoprotein glucose dehydrogenase
MSPRVLLVLTCPLLLTAGVAAVEELPGKEQTFAGMEMAGQTVALAVDDTGRVYLSCTARSFGRGVFSTESSESRRREDRAVFSLVDRRACTLRWRGQEDIKDNAPDRSESVVCLVDTNKDGRADQRTVIADGFNDILDGPAGGILALQSGGVLFGCTPSLWRLEDDNSDFRADRRLPLLTGFGIRTGRGQPGIRAMTEGPDGTIYFTTTSRGCRVQTAEGPRFVIEDRGAVFRCRPDGSDLELLATGLCDPAGIAVDLRGRVFVSDVSPDLASTRLLYVLPGADFGWDEGAPERGVFGPGVRPSWMLPEVAIIEGRATGLVIAPALANGSQLPAFVMADGRSEGGLVPVSVQLSGAGFSAVAGTPLWRGGAVCGLAAAPDGALLWADWGNGFAATSTSRICRLPPREKSAAWSDSAALLAAGIGKLPAKDLPALLEHPHPLVKWRAQQALTALGFQESLDILTRTAKRSPSMPSRLNAVWGMGALAAGEAMLLNEVLLLFSSAEPDIRALAVRIAGVRGYDGPIQELLQLLRDPSPDVRVEAACAIARLRPAGCEEALAAAITACGDSDPFLRHALTYALSCVLTPAELAERGKTATSMHVKKAALNGLRRLRAAEVADFLDDENPDIILAAADAIYDGMILPGYPPLAATLEKCAPKPQLVESGFVRRALAAALRTGTAEEAAAVASFASLPEEKLSDDLRTAAIATLATWDAPPSFESVHNRYDPPLPRPPGIARPLLAKFQPPAAAKRPEAEGLIASVENMDSADAVRVDALQQLAVLQPAKALELSRSLLPGRGTPALRAAARALIMKLEPPAVSYAQITEALAIGSPQEMQTVVQLADRFDSKQAETLWLDLGKKFIDGTIDSAVRLEVLEGLTHRDTSTRGKFRRILESAEAEIDEGADPLARWRLCETGGDPDKGRFVFESARHANCTACHSLNGRGGTEGPELDGVASRVSREQLLAALIRPSDSITHGYGHVTVTLQDGTRHSGLLRQRDDSSLLLASRTGSRRLNADAVQSISDPVSPMPSAAALLTQREIRDLVAWLATLK